MTTITFDYFDLLSNEVVANVVGFLDLVSLYRFTSTSKRLDAFKKISNEQWRRYYGQKWWLEDRELAIYKVDNWQKVYFARIKAESDYLLWLTNYPSHKVVDPVPDPTLNNGADFQQFLFKHGVRKQPKEDGGEEIYYASHIDPWAFILQEKRDDPESIKNCFDLIDGFFSEPFTEDDTKREILSGRFEIYVTGMSKYAAKDVSLLKYLNLLEDFFADDYKENRVRPYGILGLLAKYLDLTLPPDVLSVVANVLWATAEGLDEDFFIGLEIAPKVIHIALKTTDAALRTVCLAILSWLRPAKPENQKVLVNAPFMQMLIDELFQENPDNFDILPRLLITFGKFNLSVVEESRAVSRMIEMSRKYGSNPEGMNKLLVNAHALCLYSSNCGTELAQHENALEYIVSLITDSKDEDVRGVAEHAMALIDTMARIHVGAERLLELNVSDKLLSILEDPSNTHLFEDIYTTLHLLTDYANGGGFGDEIFAKLLQHKDALIDRGDESATVEVRNACNGFWMNFSSATAPPRDVSIKLIHRALPIVPSETTLKVKKDAVLLLANIAEVDLEAFAGKDLTELFNYMVEYFINFDAEVERAELLRLEKEQEKEAQLKVGGVAAAEIPESATEATNADQEEGEEVSDSMDIDNQDEEDSMLIDEEDPAGKTDRVTDCPWPLNLLAFLIRLDDLKPLAIQNERLMNKLFSLYDDDSLVYEARFLIMYFFSYLIQTPGWDSKKALEYMEDFSIGAAYDVEWNFVFSKIEPYAHLLRKDNPTPMVIFGSWVLAHMSTTEPGRQTLKKELAPEVLKWMKVYPHPRVEYNMDHFARNMKKKIRQR